MARKSKSQERQRQKRAQERRERTNKKRASAKPGAARQSAGPPLHLSHLPTRLEVPAPERCLPPVYFDATGSLIPSPRATLGLGDQELDEGKVREAWRRALIDHPPEQHPERARQVGQARDWLLDPEQGIQRTMGVLRVPDPAAWGLGADSDTQARLDAATRLAGQAAIYALVEDALWREGLGAMLKRK